MSIPIFENLKTLFRDRVVTEADYSLSNHEGGAAASSGWNRFSSQSDDDLNVDRYDLMEESYKAYRKDPRARNIIETYTSYILGDGYFVKFDNERDEGEWTEFKKSNNFDEKWRNAIRLTLVDGNHFMRLADQDNAIPQIRHLRADQVAEILSAKGDPEDITGYKGRDQYEKITWDADELIHLRVLSLGQKWGHGILEPILTSLTRKRSLENSQSVLLKILASIPIIRKGPWTAEQIATRVNDLAALPPPGTIITCNLKEEYHTIDHPAFRMNWKDQGRSLDLSIASGAGLPYYMVFSDSGDTNYAASLVAEAPAVRRFKEMQSSFANGLIQIVERTIDPSGEFAVGFYPIVPRDTEKEVRAWMEPWILQLISSRTAMEKLGIDPEEEEERMRAENRWPPGGIVGQKLEGDDVDKPFPAGGFQWRRPTKDVERAAVNSTVGAQGGR